MIRQIDALSVGPEVALLSAGHGRLTAILRQVVYLESNQGFVIGIVGAEADDGPLTLRVSDLPAVQSALAGAGPARFAATAQAILIGDAVCIRLDAARRWTPPLPRVLGSPAAREAAAIALGEALREAGSDAACGALIAPLLATAAAGAGASSDYPAEIPVAPSAAGSIFRAQAEVPPSLDEAAGLRMQAHLQQFATAWAAGATDAAGDALAALLGLGPGLTPAGDDLLGGLLAVLVWHARAGRLPQAPVDALVGAVRAAAPARTTHLSARLLWHAGGGVVYAPALALGTALLAGTPAAVLPATRRLCALGHSTGILLALGVLYGTRSAQLCNHA